MPDILLSPPLLKKSENSVVSVGKSEKSPEKILQKVFQNAYTAYTNYTDIGLALHQWLNTMPLHPTGGTGMIDIYQLV